MSGESTKARRSYGGESGDERAARRRAALLDAALGLVAEGGWAALGVDAVCRRAGLNKRYFYESFAGADELALGLTQWLADAAADAALAALADGRRDDEDSRRGVAAFVGHVTDDPRRARVLFGAGPPGSATPAHVAAGLHGLISTVASVGRELRSIDEDSVAELGASLLVGGTSQAVLDWLDGRIDCSREQLVEDLVVLWHAIADSAAARAAARGA